MKLFAVGTIFLVLETLVESMDSTMLPSGGAGFRGLPKDKSACATLVKAALDQRRKLDEGGLKHLPNMTDLKGMKTNEVLVKEKEEKLPSQEFTKVTSVENKNVTDTSDGLQTVERTEKTKEILPGNKTNEVLVKEKEEKLPSQETTKVKSVESKNVTDMGDGKDVEKETVIQKEVEKNVCNSDIKEVRHEKHLNETIEDLKHQVDDVKNMVKEEKAKAEETNATPSQCVVKEPSAAPGIQESKVVKKIVPSVEEGKGFVVTRVVEHVTPSVVAEQVPVVTKMKVAEKIPPTVTEGKVPVIKEKKVIEKVVPSVTEGKLPVVTKEEIVEKAAPSVTEEIVSVPKEQEVPVVAEEKVIEKIIPSVTEGKVQVVPQQEVVEEVAPSATEEKIPVVTQERAIEQNAPQKRVIELSAPQERATEQNAPQKRVIELSAPQERANEKAAALVVKKEITTE